MDQRKIETGKSETIIGILTKAIEANRVCTRVASARLSSTYCGTRWNESLSYLYRTEDSSPEFATALFDAVSEVEEPGAAKWEIKPPDFKVYDKVGVLATSEIPCLLTRVITTRKRGAFAHTSNTPGGWPERLAGPRGGKPWLCKSIGEKAANLSRCAKPPKREEVLGISSIAICTRIDDHMRA